MKTIEQAADEFVNELNHGLEITMEQKITDVGIFLAGAKHQKEFSDALEKLLLDVISEMKKSLAYYGKSDFDRVCFLEHSTCEENYGADARDVLLSVANKLDGLK